MERVVRWSSMVRSATLALVGALVLAAPASGQVGGLARPRTAAPDAPKLLVLPFYRDNADSALSLLIADGTRDRLRNVHMDKFNTIPRTVMNENLTNSGFPTDVPLEPAVARQLVRFLNVRYTVEASMVRRPGDSLLIIARLVEQSSQPQSATTSLTVARARANSGTGGDIANRLVEGYRVFDEVQRCRSALDQQQYPRATQMANEAIRQYPNSSAAYGCLARVLEAQNAPADSVLAVLLRGYQADTLNTIIMRSIAQKYEARGDTANLVLMLRRVLSIDFRDNDLRIRTARLLVGMGQTDQAIEVIEEGLRQNPASVELLGVKAIALGAAQHWDSAAATLAVVASIDSSKVDSLFLVRITNYFKQVPDTANWLNWVRVATEKFPSQAGYLYTLGELSYARGDTAGAIAAAQRYNAAVPSDGRGHLALARYQMGAGMLDSAVAHANAVTGDSALRVFTAPIFLQAGLKYYRDSAYARAESLLQKSVDYGSGRALVPAHFFLGLAKLWQAVALDQQVQTSHNCDDARRLVVMWGGDDAQHIQGVEQHITAGAAQNRDAANQLLSSTIPQYKQRSDQMVRRYCH
jgi:tetratricopeptide (TPR) repeat protein